MSNIIFKLVSKEIGLKYVDLFNEDDMSFQTLAEASRHCELDQRVVAINLDTRTAWYW